MEVVSGVNEWAQAATPSLVHPTVLGAKTASQFFTYIFSIAIVFAI